jgi:hypothetical protein
MRAWSVAVAGTSIQMFLLVCCGFVRTSVYSIGSSSSTGTKDHRILQASPVVLHADFSTTTDGFSYVDDLFRSTNEPAYATGTYDTNAGADGALLLSVGGVNKNKIYKMSGGWTRSFVLASPGSVTIQLNFQLKHSATYESNESGEALCSVDGVLLGLNGNDFIAKLFGGQGREGVVGFVTVSLTTGPLSSGSHTIAIGAYVNQKTYWDEVTTMSIDSVDILKTQGRPSLKLDNVYGLAHLS